MFPVYPNRLRAIRDTQIRIARSLFGLITIGARLISPTEPPYFAAPYSCLYCLKKIAKESSIFVRTGISSSPSTAITASVIFS